MYVYVYTCNNTCIKVVGTSTQFLKKYFRVTLKESHSFFLKKIYITFHYVYFCGGEVMGHVNTSTDVLGGQHVT